MSFQENLKNLRLKRGLSQKKLADAIGVAQSSINYWEKGERIPSVESTNRLADFFNVTLDELYDIDYKMCIRDSHIIFCFLVQRKDVSNPRSRQHLL